MMRGDRIGRIADQIKRKLAEHGIEAWVYGRAKRPFSIWRKLQDKQLNFEQLSDIFGFRVIVKDRWRIAIARWASCTPNWHMVPERFKDFISTPKTNGYRSIHTTVIGPEKQRVEMQIRTQEMHDIAERGVAAHWRYRETCAATRFRRGRRAINGCATWWICWSAATAPRSSSSIRASHMYQDQVFCFTPKGDLISLPRGATPIDFAYAVHTDLGNTTVGAKVNGGHVPLHTPLKNGDQVEIIRTKEQTPSPLWEQFVVTGRARAEIRRYLRHAQRDEHVELRPARFWKRFSPTRARSMTEKAIERSGQEIAPCQSRRCLCRCRPRRVARRTKCCKPCFPNSSAIRATQEGMQREQAPSAISIRGLTEGISYSLGQCCHPLPGDRIVGLMVPGEGVVIHTIDCAELEKAQSSMDDWLDVAWEPHAADSGPVGGARAGAGEECAGLAWPQ